MLQNIIYLENSLLGPFRLSKRVNAQAACIIHCAAAAILAGLLAGLFKWLLNLSKI